jgi:hypothetical protein
MYTLDKRPNRFEIMTPTNPADYPFWFRLLLVATLFLFTINVFFFIGPLSTLAVNLNALQQWQIMIASMIGLGAASIAYKAAMAKVRFDREVADKEASQTKLSLYLKLEFALVLLRH